MQTYSAPGGAPTIACGDGAMGMGALAGTLAGAAGGKAAVSPALAGLLAAAGLSASGAWHDASARVTTTAASVRFVARIMCGRTPALAFLPIDPKYSSGHSAWRAAQRAKAWFRVVSQPFKSRANFAIILGGIAIILGG